MELSIVTCTIPERAESLERLSILLQSQIGGLPVEHVVVDGDGTIGRKINAGFRRAKGRYVCVVDDDDTVPDDYVISLIAGAALDPDVVTFQMWTPDGIRSLRAGAKDEGNTRTANHLCAWRREIALTAPLLPRNYGWDVVWYRALAAGFPRLVEYHIPRVLYHYLFSPEGTRAQSRAAIADSMDNNGRRIKIVRLPDGRLAAGPHRGTMWVQNMEIIEIEGLRRKETLLDEVVFT